MGNAAEALDSALDSNVACFLGPLGLVSLATHHIFSVIQ